MDNVLASLCQNLWTVNEQMVDNNIKILLKIPSIKILPQLVIAPKIHQNDTKVYQKC